MQRRVKRTVPAYDSLANAVIGAGNVSDLIVYIARNNRFRLSYRLYRCDLDDGPGRPPIQKL